MSLIRLDPIKWHHAGFSLLKAKTDLTVYHFFPKTSVNASLPFISLIVNRRLFSPVLGNS
jgi:hypothetical protein